MMRRLWISLKLKLGFSHTLKAKSVGGKAYPVTLQRIKVGDTTIHYPGEDSNNGG